MNKVSLFCLLLLSCLFVPSFAQMTFDKGYFIDNQEQRVECLIKNKDWLNNPEKFSYKISSDKEKREATIDSVKEFGIYEFAKYVRYSVQVDTSTDKLDEMTYDRDPLFETRTIFLKTIIDSRITLFGYRKQSLVRYYFSKNGLNPDPLVYKAYKTHPKRFKWNTLFKQTLFSSLNCPSLLWKDFENLEYRKDDLVDLILKYNQCKNLSTVRYDSLAARDKLDINIRASISNIRFNNNPRRLIDPNRYENNLAFKLGVEGEFNLPFNRNMFAIIIAANYHHFKSPISNTEIILNYSTIEVPFGIRYFFLSRKSHRIFTNLSFYNEIDLSFRDELRLKAFKGSMFGIGYEGHNRYQVELRYSLNKLFASYGWESDYDVISFIIGYNIY